MTVHGPGPIVSTVPSSIARQPAPPATRPAEIPVPPTGVAPSGANPDLWSMLTPDEQAFFAEHARLGSLTYGPPQAAAPSLDVPRGQRIDLRV